MAKLIFLSLFLSIWIEAVECPQNAIPNINGTVVTEADGPVAGASIEYEYNDEKQSQRVLTATTDDQGFFELPTEDCSGSITIKAAGFLTKHKNWLSLLTNDLGGYLPRFILSPPSTLRGTVKSLKDVDGHAQIALRTDDNLYIIHSAIDQNGEFWQTGLPKGEAAVHIIVEGFVPAYHEGIALASGEDKTVNFPPWFQWHILWVEYSTNTAIPLPQG